MAVVESIREIREALILVSQLASSLNGTLGVSICGIPKQIAQHRRLFSIIESDVDNFHADAYSLKDAYVLQKALQAVYEVTIHVQAPSVTELGKALKEMASMLHVGIERKNIAHSMIALMDVVRKVGIGDRQKTKLDEHKLLDKELLAEYMKEDVAELPQAFRNKITELKNLAPHLSETLTEAQQVYLNACAKYDNNMHALEVSELSLGFLRILHDEIVKEEAKINSSNLHIEDGSVLGKGLFGSVNAAKLFVDNKGAVEVAVRRIAFKQEMFKREYVTMMNEITYWANFPHDYATILKFHGLCLDKDTLYLVTESYPFTLQHALHETKVSLRVEEAHRISGEIILALMQLHDLNIIHRNLNPSNILFASADVSGKIKVSDFGLGFSEYFQHQEGGSSYYAPEVLTSKPEWTFAADMYAFGLIMWELYQDDKEPFENEKFFLYDHVVVGKNRPDVKSGKIVQHRFMQTLCERCWDQDPVRRPLAGTAAEAIKTRKPIEAATFVPRPPEGKKKPVTPKGPVPPTNKFAEEQAGMAGKRGSFARMNGQITELSRDSLEEMGEPMIPVQQAVNLVGKQPRFDVHRGETPNKRLMKLTQNELCHDHLDLDTPVFYSFFGGAKLKDYDCAIIGELLKRNNTWVRLGLSFNRIGNLGLHYLADALVEHKMLVKLYLSSNKISRIGPLAAALEKNSTLQFLDLESNELGDIAATSISEILKKNKSLIYLNVSQNLFTNDGAEAIATGIRANHTLRALMIEGKDQTMGKKGRKLLKAAVKGKNIKLKTWGL